MSVVSQSLLLFPLLNQDNMSPLKGRLAKHGLQEPIGRRSCRTADWQLGTGEHRAISQDLDGMLLHPLSLPDAAAQIQLTHLLIKNLVLCFYDKYMTALALPPQPSIV